MMAVCFIEIIQPITTLAARMLAAAVRVLAFLSLSMEHNNE
jgi:hypothetical protein